MVKIVFGPEIAPAAWQIGESLLPQGFTQPAGHIAVSLVQPSIPQDQKFDAELFARHLAILGELIHSARGCRSGPRTAARTSGCMPIRPASRTRSRATRR